ncbi:MAG: NTP transferase domain-containing protein [Elusimicrobiota bacterium]
MISIILAAGKSLRMGEKDKALLKIKDKTFIEEISLKLRKVSDKLIIVAGKQNIKKITSLNIENAIILLNPKYFSKQLNSLKVAVRYLQSKNIKTPIMINLVDQPLIKLSTYKKIINFYKKNKNSIIIPKVKIQEGKDNFYFKRGHPIIIPAKYLSLIINAPYKKGLHWVTHHPKVKVMDLVVSDKNILKDIDTRQDYIKYIKG